MRVALACNGLIPGCGVPNGAQGLRSFGFRKGLAVHGIAADIVTRESVVTDQQRRWGQGPVRFCPGWRVVPNTAFENVVNRDYTHVVFSNWGAVGDYEKLDGVRMIYDFFSPTMLEHSFIADEETLAERKALKEAALAMSDAFLANGDGRARYGERYLAGCGIDMPGQIPSARLALPWLGSEPDPQPRPFRVFFGGFDQAWTRGATFHEVAAIAARAGIQAHVIGLRERLHGERLRDAGPATEEGVVVHPVAPFERFCRINRQCAVAVDVFEENEERRQCYSTRAVTSLANGVPVITMAFTEVGQLVAETGAGWCLDRFDLNALEALIGTLKEDPARVTAAREATRDFWTAYADPGREATALIEVLKG